MDEMENFYPALDEKELKDESMKDVSVEGTPILFIKQHGQIIAIDNRCPHQGCSFSSGTLDANVIICPCHEWRFNLESGEYEEQPAFKLTKYEWMIKDGKIWVKLED